MTVGRLTQAGLEVLSSVEEYDTRARLTQVGLESLSNVLAFARLTQAGFEVLSSVEEAGLPYTFTYSAGAGGSITGNSPQSVEAGDDGETVTAEADDGYYFTGWSDGVPTAVRRDLDAAEDINVTATFAAIPAHRPAEDRADYRGYPFPYEPEVEFAALPNFQKALLDTELEAIRVFLSHTRQLLNFATADLGFTATVLDSVPAYIPATDFSDKSPYSQATLLIELAAIKEAYDAVVDVLDSAATALGSAVRIPAVFRPTSVSAFDADTLDADLAQLSGLLAQVRAIIERLWRDDWTVR